MPEDRRKANLGKLVALLVFVAVALFTCPSAVGRSNQQVPPLFTEPGWNAQKPSEIGIDDFQSNRSPDVSYRTAPFRGLFAHMKGGFYHDGRFATLLDVVNHYNSFKRLSLTEREKKDLIPFVYFQDRLHFLAIKQKTPAL